MFESIYISGWVGEAEVGVMREKGCDSKTLFWVPRSLYKHDLLRPFTLTQQIRKLRPREMNLLRHMQLVNCGAGIQI